MRQTGRGKSIRGLIGFELFTKVAGLSLCVPVFRVMMQLCLRASGYSYLTRKNLIPFLRSPLTIVCIVFVVLCVSFFVLLEMNAVSIAVWKGYRGQSAKLSDLFFGGMERTRQLFRSKAGGIIISVLTLLFVLIINLPVVVFCLLGIRQTEELAKSILQPTGIQFILILSVILWWAAMLGCAIVLLAEIENGQVSGLLKTGLKGIGKCYGKIIKGLLKRSILLLLLEIVFYFVGVVTMTTYVLKTWGREASGVILLRGFERYHLLICLFFVSVNSVIYEYFCGDLLLSSRKKKDVLTVLNRNVSKDRKQKEKRAKKDIVLFVIGAVVCFTVFTDVLFFFRNGSVIFSEAMDEVAITAHRGASGSAPENTIAAIERALEEGADYVEIDIRMTSDGVPVLLHDDALFRTTRVYNKVGKVTFEQLSEYDAGSSYSSEFEGERIPSLEEVLERFGGKVGFNIELKAKKSKELTKKVVEMIEYYHLEDSCVITSMSYEQLEWVKEFNKKIKTGHIISPVFGTFYDNTAADFYSIRSDAVSEELVTEIHSLGKEVHAWTVNREYELLRMRAVGVDNIITNKPAYARRVVFSNELTDTLEEMIALLVSKK